MISSHEVFQYVHRNIIGGFIKIFCALFVLSAAACGRGNSLRWTEDVLLPDGRIVMLKRYQEFKGAYYIGETPSESDYWFEFENPDTGETVRWSHNRDLGTVALMIEKKEPYLLLATTFGSSEFEFNCPNPPYLLFRYAGGTWKRIELSQIPVKRLRSNMTYLPKGKRQEIESNNNHRSVEQTKSSYISTAKRWLMDFTNVQQTFVQANCDRPSDYLLVSDSVSQTQKQ